MDRLIAIDGNSLMYRAYFALPNMTTKTGIPTGAVYGFLSMLLKLLERQPTHIVVAFDLAAPTFRHVKYAEYKGKRPPTPDDLRTQFPIIKQVLTDMGIAICELETYEADDILGTFARCANERGIFAHIVTGDRDALQLVSDMTNVIMTKKGISETVDYDPDMLMTEYSLTPDKMKDLKGLTGDTSDNLPGIPGVGEKTALKLLAKYGSMEEALTRGAVEEKGALQKKLTEHAESARMSYELGTINTHVPIEVDFDKCRLVQAMLSSSKATLEKYELRSIIKRLSEQRTSDSAEDVHVESPTVTPVVSPEINTIALSDVQIIIGMRDDLLKSKEIAIVLDDSSVSFATSADTQYCGKFGGTLLESGLDIDEVIEALRPIFESEVQKIVYDAKAFMHRLNKRGVALNGLKFDAMIGDYLINAVHPATSFSELFRDRAATDFIGAADLLALSKHMETELTSKGLFNLYRDMEQPLIRVLYDMESTGFYIDSKVLSELSDKYAQRKKELETQIFELTGEDFNLQSPKQLGVVLFEKLKLPPGKRTATGFSTNMEVLESLYDYHPIIPLIIEHRFIAKLKSTFVDGLNQQIDRETGRVHTTFNQNITATGRISSTEPNLQNIPIRTDEGSKIRKAFCASEGNVLLDADYSQIELRVLAHMSGDETMINAFCSDKDIHTITASEVFGVAPDMVTKDQRRAAKAVNFGIVYGISEFGLAKNLNITRKQAGEYIQMYFRRYPSVHDYMRDSVEQAKKAGFVTTLFGRRRDMDELKSSNHNMRAFGERVAMNMPIQGTAADIIKMAMVKVHAALIEGDYKAKLVLQIHDELIIDTPKDEIDAVSQILSSSMQNVVKLKVPLIADVNVGDNWFDAK